MLFTADTSVFMKISTFMKQTWITIMVFVVKKKSPCEARTHDLDIISMHAISIHYQVRKLLMSCHVMKQPWSTCCELNWSLIALLHCYVTMLKYHLLRHDWSWCIQECAINGVSRNLCESCELIVLSWSEVLDRVKTVIFYMVLWAGSRSRSLRAENAYRSL